MPGVACELARDVRLERLGQRIRVRGAQQRQRRVAVMARAHRVQILLQRCDESLFVFRPVIRPHGHLAPPLA